MKTYPSIPYTYYFSKGRAPGFLHTFAKLDGSNLRFEWSKKRGWYKAGTRCQLLNPDDPLLGPAAPLFQETFAEHCAKVTTDQRWERVVVFAEYYGEQSLAGQHVLGDKMQLTLIDVAPYKKGILPPKDFLKLFGEHGPHYLGYLEWTEDFVKEVMHGEVPGSSFEGVVGKATEGKLLHMYKAKQQAWKDEVLRRYPKLGAKLIES